MFGVGWTEILLILVVALLFLGPSKLPEIAKGLGKGIREFKKAVSSLEDDEPPRKASYSTEVRHEPVPAPPAIEPPKTPGEVAPAAPVAPVAPVDSNERTA